MKTIYIQMGSALSIVVDKSTKNLIKRLKPKQVAVIFHSDLDEVAIQSLILKKPAAIINFATCITGRYPTKGVEQILRAGIPIYEISGRTELFDSLRDEMKIYLDFRNHQAFLKELNVDLTLIPITHAYIAERNRLAKSQFNQTFQDFAENTLWYAQRETKEICKPFVQLPLKTRLFNRPVIVVVRSASAQNDLETLLPFIKQMRPVLIGVDGGADILLDFELTPHIIIGDMDSVSEKALLKAKERIVHSYPNGESPGLSRLEDLNIPYHILPSIGTSEDAALLFAFEHGAKPIILVGSHSHMIDFLEKGRRGMGSTILTRMKMGHVLIDVKGYHYIYSAKADIKFSYLLLAAMIPFLVFLLSSPGLRTLAYALWVELRIMFY